MYNLGIMGGTFDPIHYGHLVAAEEARVQFNLREVVFVPAGEPPHKKDYKVTPPEHRYLMTSLAIATNPYFQISRFEIEHKGPSYTIDTLKSFKKDYKDAKIYFITGTDAILEILSWHQADNLPNLCSFIAVSRPGYQMKEVRKNLSPDYLKSIHRLEIPALAISSSDIRSRVKTGKPVKYLLPRAVESYIYQHKLYQEP